MRKLRRAVRFHLQRFASRDVANVSWALVTLSYRDDELFQMLMQKAQHLNLIVIQFYVILFQCFSLYFLIFSLQKEKNHTFYKCFSFQRAFLSDKRRRASLRSSASPASATWPGPSFALAWKCPKAWHKASHRTGKGSFLQTFFIFNHFIKSF